MQLHEAAEIMTAPNIALANEKLAEGWKLLAVSTQGRGGDMPPCYVLGLSKKAAGYIPTVGAVQMDVRD